MAQPVKRQAIDTARVQPLPVAAAVFGRECEAAEHLTRRRAVVSKDLRSVPEPRSRVHGRAEDGGADESRPGLGELRGVSIAPTTRERELHATVSVNHVSGGLRRRATPRFLLPHRLRARRLQNRLHERHGVDPVARFLLRRRRGALGSTLSGELASGRRADEVVGVVVEAFSGEVVLAEEVGPGEFEDGCEFFGGHARGFARGAVQ
mmetsp:Transcript_16272/g.49242  ORF Transcript_16272/g.49242 Transcript_16272/m.49242 type:complete len:207 (-) Transcript_16272:326-946(-)